MKRCLSLLIVLCLALSLAPMTTATTQQHDYSTTANSGIRHEICTTLSGTSASDYYTGANTYEALRAKSGTELLTALRNLMRSTHTKQSTYNNCRDMAVKTDCENADGTSISLLYTSYSATWADWCNNRKANEQGWNREHVWPKNLGGFDTIGVGADLHHVRPSDQPINNKRGNLKYGNVNGGSAAKGAAYTGGLIGGYSGGGYFEPLDNVKGDVARICLYVYVRYGGELSKCNNITNVFESVDVLLEWCALDPVDTWEMGRNEVVGAFQGNRNVFIDYPELAWLIFNKEIPADLTTPSGDSSAPIEPTECAHSRTVLKDAYDATCTEMGYSGDTYCADCGEMVSSGYDIPELDHINENNDNTCDRCNSSVTCGHGKTQLKGATDATCGSDGYSGDTYCFYCNERVSKGQTIPATGEHHYVSGTCSVCGNVQPTDPPVTEPPVTEPPVTEPPVTEPPVTEPPVTEPPTQPTEPPTVPTDPSSQPTEPTAQPTQPSTKPTTPADPTEPDEPDYGWLVFVVIGVAVCGCALTVAFTKKRNHS